MLIYYAAIENVQKSITTVIVCPVPFPFFIGIYLSPSPFVCLLDVRARCASICEVKPIPSTSYTGEITKEW